MVSMKPYTAFDTLGPLGETGEWIELSQFEWNSCEYLGPSGA